MQQGGPSKVSQVTQDMATRMLHMAQFLRRKGPIAVGSVSPLLFSLGSQQLHPKSLCHPAPGRVAPILFMHNTPNSFLLVGCELGILSPPQDVSEPPGPSLSCRKSFFILLSPIPLTFIPFQSKEQFVACARQMASDGQVVVKFGNILAKHCLDRRCSMELLRAAEHTQSVSSQLSIVAR